MGTMGDASCVLFQQETESNSTCHLHDPFLDVSGWLYIISAELLSPNVHGRF